MSDKELTFGERAVGLTFNPGNNTDVDAIKREYAVCIDRMHKLRLKESGQTGDREIARMASLAITAAQEAQMWAVKACTWNK